MAIRIVRNEAGNCINFYGSSNPTYWNSCLSGQVDPDDNTKVNVINDIQSAAVSETKYEFYQLPFTDFADKDGGSFADAQAAADYITQEGNVIGVSDVGADLTGVDVNFRLDQTTTSIIMDNGSHFGVNTIKAVADVDGTIHIHAIGAGVPSGTETENDHKHFEKLEHNRVSVNGSVVSGGLQDVANTLNELFTVGAFEAVVIADPYSTMVADVSGTATTYSLVGSTVVDPIGDDIATNSSTGNYAGVKTTDTIDQAGEYFTFDIRGEGQIGFGLVISDTDYAAGNYATGSNVNYIDPSSFAVGNSAHYGFQFSHWFHPTPNGSWTNYGANTGYVGRSGWSGWESKDEWLAGDPVKVKVGIDENGYIAISTLQDDNTTWIVHARTSYPVPDGADYHLGIKFANSSPRLHTAPKVHLLEPAAPTMQFRYIESPDNNFQYPLFATAEEAEYYDQNHDGTTGSGTYTNQVFVDDATNTQWYAPDTGFTDDGTVAPTGTFMGNSINWTLISSLSNADLVPSSFGTQSVSVDEGSPINTQVVPAGASGYTTTITDPSGNFSLSGDSIQGTAPQVASDNVTNPSDDYPITVTRTNSYGSSTGTLTITVLNLDAPVVQAITGFTWEATSVALIAEDELDADSVVSIDDAVADGRRLIINQTWVEANVLPNLTASGDSVILGVAATSPTWSDGADVADFDASIKWAYSSSSAHSVTLTGATSSSFTVNSATDAFYDYAIEVDGTDVQLIACNVNSINTEPSVNDGGSFTHTLTVASMGSGPHTIHVGPTSTTMDVATTGLSEIDIPAASTNLTPWTKALDFDGSHEHLKQVSSSMYSQALQMNGLASTVTLGTRSQGETSDSSTSRPWATAVVFKSSGYNGNQIIWNQGEGASSGDDNIYLRVSASGSLMFGWGRYGVGSNECRIVNQSISSSNWYGVSVAHSGERLSGNNASSSNLADCFDIRLMSSSDSFASISSNLSTSSNWITSGIRMDRTVAGDFTVGGRSSSSYMSYRGKVASMVVTTLIGGGSYTPAQYPAGYMPDADQAKMMITDPVKWVANYKVRYSSENPNGLYRKPAERYATSYLLTGSSSDGYRSALVWLMGDGTSDSYANGVRNYVNTADQNHTKMQLNSMVSNDFQTVNIAGLT